jgi:hypothetical protein
MNNIFHCFLFKKMYLKVLLFLAVCVYSYEEDTGVLETKLKFVVYDVFHSEKIEELLIKNYRHYFTPLGFIDYLSLVEDNSYGSVVKRYQIVDFAKRMRGVKFSNKVNDILMKKID